MPPDADKSSIATNTTICDLCHGTETEVALPLEGRALVRCRGCGLVRLDPVPTADELTEVYDTGAYYTHEPPRVGRGLSARVRNAVLETFWGYPGKRGALTRGLLSIALRPLRYRVMPIRYPDRRAVLDIGCGNGQRLLELEVAGCRDLHGVEPSAGAAEQARLGTTASIHTGLLEQAPLPKDHFDLIIMNQVLEHVPSPTNSLRDVCGMLKPGGELYLTVPNFGSLESSWFGPHWSGLQVPAHLHHFTREPLRKLIEGAGLRVTTWRTDSVPQVTAASREALKEARPTGAKAVAAALPAAAWTPATLMADLLGRGQMFRIVAQRA
jgi:SAM-dependent methyltransferase